MKRTKIKIAGATAAAAAVLGGGGAIAATQLSPTEESDAIVADAAKQLGIDADKLDAALKEALENRVDAAVEAGRLTEAQAAELKERIAAGELPLIGLGAGRGHHGGHHGFFAFEAAATYLGITEAELRASLEDGDTLAEIAVENGKTAAGLTSALVAATKAKLDEKVEEGMLTEAERTSILAELQSRIAAVVNGEAPFGFRGGPGRGGPGGFGGERPAEAPDA